MLPPISEIGEETVRAIAPYIPTLWNQLDAAEAKAADAADFEMARALYEQLWMKVAGDEPTRTALARVAAEPERKACLRVLQVEVIALLAREEGLAQALADILTAAQGSSSPLPFSAGDVTDSVLISGAQNRVTFNKTVNKTVYEAARKPERTGAVSNVPGGGSQTFVGRDDTLTQLHERLSVGAAVAITAIQGMGGIGKTELARQYAKRYAGEYAGGVCWLQSRDLDVATQIVEFAQVYLQLVPPEGVELAAQVAYCWAHWPGSGPVLVVYDDVTDYGRVAALVPPEGGRFVVLMTTRRQNLAVTVMPFEIEVLGEGAALELLLRIVTSTTLSHRQESSEDIAAAQAICEWVGYLPLGLELVGQYLRQKPEVSYEKLRGRLGAQRTAARALQKAYPGMTGKLGVIEAFELSWQTLPEDSQDMACWLSLFALAPIPWEMAVSAIDEAEQEDAEEGRDVLIERSLLRRVDVGGYQLHQLVREYFLAKLAQREDADEWRQAYCDVMVTLAQQMPGSPTRELLLGLTPVMPHIAEVTTSWLSWLSDEEHAFVWPFVAMARFYKGQGAYAQAEPWYANCLTATKSRFGKDHPAVATSLNNLALLYKSQGRYEEAEPLYVDGLALSRKLLGEDHPAVATSLNNLASLYKNQGRYEEAEPLYADGLALSRKLLGENHPDVASSLNNLASLYESQGRYEEAEPLYADGLALSRKLLGEDHPDVASSLNNLASLYKNQGRYEEAEPLYVDGLALSRKLLGENHPDVASSLNNLASLYKNQGRYEEAEPLYVDGLALRRKLLGEDHPAVATSLNNLASLYESQGRYEEAEPLYADGLALSRKLLGENHPDVASSLNNLASLYKNQGRYEEAEPLYADGLALSRKLLGENHPDVASSLNNLASLYKNQGRYEEAEPLYADGLALRRKLLGENHPDVASSLNNLASLYKNQGRYEEAEPLYVQAIAILLNRLGENHPNTRTGFNNFWQFVAAVLAAGRQSELSDHPATQSIVEKLQSQSAQD